MAFDNNLAFDLKEPISPRLSIDVSRYLSEPDIPMLRTSTDDGKSASIRVPANYVTTPKNPNEVVPAPSLSCFPFAKRTSSSQNFLDVDLKSLRVRISEVKPLSDDKVKCNQEVDKSSPSLISSSEKACSAVDIKSKSNPHTHNVSQEFEFLENGTIMKESISKSDCSSIASRNPVTFSRTNQLSNGKLTAPPIYTKHNGQGGLSTGSISSPKCSPEADKLSDDRTTCEIYDISTTADIGDCPPTLDLVNSSDLSLLATKPCSEFLKPTLINKGKSSNSVGITKQQQSISTSKNVLTVNNQHYQFIRVLGEGGSSKVYEVIGNKLNLLAIKCVNLKNADKSICQSYQNEISVLLRLQGSDRVVKLYDHEFNECQKMLYVVMERGDVDLATVIKSNTDNGRITPEMVKFYWSEMLRAVEVIHKEGIIHSDLKPANFLLVAGQLKLIDFGIASMIPNDATSIIKDTRSGTVNYMSPEALINTCDDNDEDLKIRLGVKSDVWSLGCILYHMVYRCTPFHGIRDNLKKMNAITNSKYSIEFQPLIDGHLLDVLKKCIVRDPKQRPSISQLLQHPYLTATSRYNPPLVSLMNSISELSPGSIERVSQVVDKIKAKKKSSV